MWIAPLVVLAPIVLRVFGIDWGRDAVDVVALVLVTGLLIGYVEELLTRGIGVKMLRAGGHGEWAVAALSSLVFALLHSVNLLTGQELHDRRLHDRLCLRLRGADVPEPASRSASWSAR